MGFLLSGIARYLSFSFAKCRESLSYYDVCLYQNSIKGNKLLERLLFFLFLFFFLICIRSFTDRIVFGVLYIYIFIYCVHFSVLQSLIKR